MKKYCFGVDVGGTTIKMGFFDTEGNVLDKWEIPTRTENGGENVLPDIAKAVKDKLAEKQIDKEEVSGIGVGVPGPVDSKGVVYKCVNLGWGIFNVNEKLEDLTGISVKAGNDANVAALGEMWKGGGQGFHTLVVVTLGTGVGGGIILDGQMLTGAKGAGGEIGHIHMNDEEPDECGCGNHGCLEQYASATGVVRLAKRALAKATEKTVLNADTVTAKDVWDAVKEGDPVALQVAEQFGKYLGEGLRLYITSEESKAINFEDTPKVIISASGMCEAGRIRHHLKHNLWRPECTILFVGYQAIGTLGRSIVDGKKEVKLFGEPIEIRASIKKLEGLSGHADKNGLIGWLQKFEKKPDRVFIVHGEDAVCTAFAQCLKHEYGYSTYAPYSGTEVDLMTGDITYEAEGIPVKKRKIASDVFSRLLAAGQRLLAVIQHNEGGTNKDLAKFTDQINALCDKWDR